MVSYVICDRIIDEVRGWRCDRIEGHAGLCKSSASAGADKRDKDRVSGRAPVPQPTGQGPQEEEMTTDPLVTDEAVCTECGDQAECDEATDLCERCFDRVFDTPDGFRT